MILRNNHRVIFTLRRALNEKACHLRRFLSIKVEFSLKDLSEGFSRDGLLSSIIAALEFLTTEQVGDHVSLGYLLDHEEQADVLETVRDVCASHSSHFNSFLFRLLLILAILLFKGLITVL